MTVTGWPVANEKVEVREAMRGPILQLFCRAFKGFGFACRKQGSMRGL